MIQLHVKIDCIHVITLSVTGRDFLGGGEGGLNSWCSMVQRTGDKIQTLIIIFKQKSRLFTFIVVIQPKSWLE